MDAYPVPFRVDRSAAPRYRLVNASSESLCWVRVEMAGPGLVAAGVTPRLAPGGALDIVVGGRDLAQESRLCVRWLRPNGEEYLWAIAF